MSSLDTRMDEKMAELERKQKEFVDTVLKAKDDQIRAQNEQIEQMKEKLAMLEMNEKGKGLQERPVESVGELPPHPAFTFPAQLNPKSALSYRSLGSGPSQLPTFRVGATGENLRVSPIDFMNDQPNLTRPERSKNQGFGQAFSDKNADKWKMIEDRLEAIEKIDDCFEMNVSQLSLVPDLVLPPKFKMPEFEKFDGNSCPVMHLKMFCRKMTGHGQDDKLLIHCFQESLAGSASRWYNQLNSSSIQSWMNLVRAFKEQYKHLNDFAPDITTLLSMEKKTNESFREYARRFRDVAGQVKPALGDQVLPKLFIDTLKPPFFERLCISIGRSFSEIVTSGEMIERAIKNGKLNPADSGNTRSASTMRNEVNSVSENKSRSYSYNQNRSNRENGPPRPKPQFTSIPVSYKDLLPYLFEKGLATPCSTLPRKPPYPKWYNPNAHCDYHAGAEGHDIEGCLGFKKLVQNLQDTDVLGFDPSGTPVVIGNPSSKYTE